MTDYFSNIPSASFQGPDSRDPFSFRFYNPEEEILGKKMKDHLRFAVAYWHTFRGTGSDPFGSQTLFRPWDDGSESLENAERRLRVCFEFLKKLSVEFYCFHDRDIAPEGKSLKESHDNLDKVVAVAKQLQQDTGLKLLWGTANLFSNPRYLSGAGTNPDAHAFAYAAAQVKKAMEVTKELGGSNYVFWGGREGYQTLLNTDMKRELDHMAEFLRMAADYKKEIGFNGVLLIEPKPKEPTKHQYDFDAAAVISFLREYSLENEFKLNIEANHATLATHSFEHDLQVASNADLLGSVDANTGDTLLGWDTDQFNIDVRSTTLAMLVVLNQGGLFPGGFNFDAKVRRESIDVEDLFFAHISSMDAFARGLRNAVKIKEDGVLSEMVRQRYSSFDSGIGSKIENGEANFKELEQWVLDNGETTPKSGQQELYELILNDYLK